MNKFKVKDLEISFGLLASYISDTTFNEVQIDSREVQEGDIFFALSGESTNGH